MPDDVIIASESTLYPASSLIQFIAYEVNTGPKDVVNKTFTTKSGDKFTLPWEGTYTGKRPISEDIRLRCQLMCRAIDTAHSNSHPAAKKVFVAPEFYFRGPIGAYTMDEYQSVLKTLRTHVRAERFKGWTFLFGTILAFSRPHEQTGWLVRQLTSRASWYPVDTAADAEIYNVCVVQEGGFGDVDKGADFCEAVMKDFRSDVDFVTKDAGPDGLILLKADHMEHNKSASHSDKYGGGDGEVTVGGLKLGVEICLDHAKQRLLNRKKSVPVQLIPSCGMSIKAKAVVAQPGGWVFNCNGSSSTGDSTLRKVTSPAQTGVDAVLEPAIAKESDTKVDVSGIPVADLFAQGGGRIVAYPPVMLPS
jgi:hypothetical protein